MSTPERVTGAPARAAAIEVRDLSKRFGARCAVGPVALRVVPGEIFGLVGPNGCGKSTLLRLLAGLIAPDSGSGTVLGWPVEHIGREARRNLGYLPQRPALYTNLSVLENLRFRAAVFGVANPRSAAAAASSAAGLEQRAGEPLARFSGGWLRRVEIAATLIHQPRLLLLDEPTTGLDQGARAAIWSVLQARAAAGTAIVMASHDAKELQLCSDTLRLDV